MKARPSNVNGWYVFAKKKYQKQYAAKAIQKPPISNSSNIIVQLFLCRTCVKKRFCTYHI